jgi:integration host factor subunit beta
VSVSAGIVTKADLITIIADKLKLPWARAELLVEEIFLSMSDSLMRGEKIEIRGFGSFTVRQYRAYDGRNPRTVQPSTSSPSVWLASRWGRRCGSG